MPVLCHGKEIYSFFGKYEFQGMVGIVISSFGVSVLIYKVFKIITKNNINNYDDFLSFVLEKNKYKNKILKTINLIINAFLLISFYIMMAGLISYFREAYDINTYIISIIAIISCYIILNKNIEGIIKINTICVPIIIVFIVFLGIKNLDFAKIEIYDMIFNIKFKSWGISITSALLYAGYNSILLIPIIINLKKYCKEKDIKVILFSIMFLIIILAYSIFFTLIKGNLAIMQMDMPIAYIIRIFEKKYSLVYGIVITISILTSIISAGYSLLKNCSKNEKIYRRNLKLICLSSILISNIGFSKLINLLYPIFGLFGIIQIGFILLRKV